MKNEPWIDRVYKEKAETWDLPVNQTHWQQAESMIGHQEDQKKRAFWMRMAAAGGLALALLVSLFLFRNLSLKKQPEARPLPSGTPLTEPMAQSSGPEQEQVPYLEDPGKKQTTVTASFPVQNHPPPVKPNVFNGNSNGPARVHQKKMIHQNNSVMPDLVSSPVQMHVAVQSADAASSGKTVLERQNESEKKLDRLAFFAIGPTAKSLPLSALEVPVDVDYKPFKRKEFGLRLDLTRQAENGRSASMSMAGLEVFARSPLSSKSYWDLSLGYNSFFNSSLYSEIMTSYQFQGFGATVKNYGIKPEWIHYLYLQLAGGMQLNKHRAFAGIRPQLLLGAIGEVDQIRFKDGTAVRDLSSAEISNLGNGWLEKGSLHQLVFNVHLGYEYQFHRKFGLGLQASRFLNDLYRPLPGDITQRPGAKWNIGMRISYKLK